MHTRRRVVITGIGITSPCGLDADSTWKSVTSGQSGIARITNFDSTEFACHIAGEVKGFDPEKWIEKKRVREMDRFIHFAMAAAQMAIESSGFAPDDELRDRTGTFVGVGLCGLATLENTAKVLAEKGPRKITPYFIPATIANLAPGQISMRWNLRGPSYSTSSACSSSGHALGEAFKWIQRGDIDAAVAGGAEATVTPLGVGGFTAMRALSTRNDEPTKASRPYDKGRDGFVMGEGSAMLILEERDLAMKRGATILAELVGYGTSADAYHLTQPAPEGEGAQRAMRMALKDGGIDAGRIDYINAHGTSTPTGDINELKAIRAVFGDRAIGGGLWVSATKSMTGHLLGASGALEAAICVLGIRDGIVPPTINLDDPDDEAKGFELVPHEARKRSIDVALSNSFGFGGTNVSLAIARPT
jgi:3-oxoacyl-[acyl-carrier-protein] synthase II